MRKSYRPVSYTHLDVYKRQPEALEGELYKYCIHTKDGRELYKADPYAFCSEKRPGNASRIASIGGYKWGDALWMQKRQEFSPQTSPLSIYEVHPGSWKKHPWTESNPEGFYNYKQMAQSLSLIHIWEGDQCLRLNGQPGDCQRADGAVSLCLWSRWDSSG